MRARNVLAGFIILAFALCACKADSTPLPPAPTEGEKRIGTVSAVQARVQAGPIGDLTDVTISQFLYSYDGVYVTEGGVALLNFFDQVVLKLFNDAILGGVNVEILESSNKRLHMKLERGGLSGQVVKGSGGVDFEIANGVHVYILGTRFYLVYDLVNNIVSVGNFDGVVGYQVPGYPPQMLPAGRLADIFPDATVKSFDMTFDLKSFDMAAQINASPIDGLRKLRGGTTALAPVPTASGAPTSVVTAGAVLFFPSATATARQASGAPPYILSVILTPDTPQPGLTLIPTDPALSASPSPSPAPPSPSPTSTPALTPTSTDAPAYFQNPAANPKSCIVSFSVVVSDADGIDAVKVIYSVNGVKSFLAVMNQSQGVYVYSTSLTQNTAPSDSIIYYFKAVDLQGRVSESPQAVIQADTCQLASILQ